MAQKYLRSSDPNTLQGYDLVITVSQDAINKQFQTLYETEIPPKVMPLPEGMEDHRDLPPAKYYINHDLTIRPMTQEDWDEEEFEGIRPEERPEDGKFWLESSNWIEGEIAAPYVTFGEEDPVNHHCVRVHLRFIKGILHYNLNGHNVQYKLADCVLSWLVDLSHKQVGDVLENIIKPSRDKKQPTLVSEPILKKLESVKNENYTVTTLFCLFESTRIVNSFKFIDKAGLSKFGSSAADAAATLIGTYFAALSNKGGVGSTPNNPFVLGYGVTQSVGDETEEQLERSEHVPYMVPKSFDLTVTPGDKQYSNGVLNYCIITNREKGTEATVLDRQVDANAGIWRAWDTPYSRIRANGMKSGADGVIAISRGVFRDLWLKEKFLEYFKVNLSDLSSTLVPDDDNVAQPPDVAKEVDVYDIGKNNANELAIRQTFQFKDMPCQDMDTAKIEKTEELSTVITVILEVFKSIGLEISYKQQRLAAGYAEAVLTYSSDVQKNPTLGMDSDASRKIYFDVLLKSNVIITQQAAGICNVHRLKENGWRNSLWLTTPTALYEVNSNLDFYKRIFSEWRNARQAKIDISAKVGMNLSPAEDTWKLELVDAQPRTTIPLVEGQEMERHVFPPRECSTIENIFLNIESSGSLMPAQRNEDGVYIALSNHEIFKEFGTSKGMDGFAKPAQQWASGFESIIEGHMAALAGSLASKLILPAGEVYEFKSLNTDKDGHVYSLLGYKTSTNLSQL